MSLFTHNYSSIITKGLGSPACCSLIVASFSLTGMCNVEIVVPTPITYPTANIGGGGGGFLVPFPKDLQQQTKMVLITVKFTPDKVWRKSYVVDSDKADILVKVMNFGNKAKDNISIGIEHIKTATKRVVAIFTPDDK